MSTRQCGDFWVGGFSSRSIPGFCHCCMILVKSLTSAWTSWSIFNTALTILKTFLRSLTFMEDKCNRQAGYYSPVVWWFLISGWCIHDLCYCSWLSPLPLANGIALWSSPRNLPGGGRAASAVTGFCWRITVAFGEIRDKDTPFFLLPAVLPNAWVYPQSTIFFLHLAGVCVPIWICVLRCEHRARLGEDGYEQPERLDTNEVKRWRQFTFL